MEGQVLIPLPALANHPKVSLTSFLNPVFPQMVIVPAGA